MFKRKMRQATVKNKLQASVVSETKERQVIAVPEKKIRNGR